MNKIIRPLAHNLGFDEFGQLIVSWEEHGGTCSTMCADVREKVCPICGKGWEVSAESFRNQYLERITDEWCHKTCYVGHLAMAEMEMWSNLLCYPEVRTDFIPHDMKKIPNEYGGAWKTPWYKITLLGYLTTIKVGTRKRVYAMSLHDLRSEQAEAFMALVAGEDVTKGNEGTSVYIHAWNKAKATEYLRHFVTVIRMDRPTPGSRAAEFLADEEKHAAEQRTKIAA